MSVPDPGIVWNHIVRHFGDRTKLTVDELEASLKAEKFDVDRSFVVGLFKDFTNRKLGDFYTGRRGHASRILWNKKPSQLSPGWVLTNGASSSAAPKMLEHELPLRPGVTGKLILPVDLSAAEAARVIDFVKLLPLPSPA